VISRDINISRRVFLMSALVTFTSGWSSESRRRVQLYVASEGDELRFVPNQLTCVEGARVKLHFHHAGRISSDAHDWVLLEPGTADAFVQKADHQADEGSALAISSTDVLAATRPCKRGQTVSVEFVAPPAGEYPFVCSIPGHGAVMRGTLFVTRFAKASEPPA
jgi:azurin